MCQQDLLRQSHYVIKLEMRLRFILTFWCFLFESQKPFCTLSLFNSKQNLTTRNMKAKIEHSVACDDAQLCSEAGSQVSSSRAVQDPDSSLWCMFRPPTLRCGPALTAFTKTSGRRQVLFSIFLPISDSLHSLYIPMRCTHTNTHAVPFNLLATARLDTQECQNMKRNQFKRANLPIFKREVYFYSLQLDLLRVCGSNQGTLRGRVRVREIMFTDSTAGKL